MEQTITQNQVMTLEQAQKIERWQQEEVLLLARHFQRLNETKNKPFSGHYTRTNYFKMKCDDVTTLNDLKDDEKTIQRIKTHMALEVEDKKKFTFVPIIEIDLADTFEKLFFSLEPKYKEPVQPNQNGMIGDINNGGVLVPGIFKEMILTNWNNLEDNLVDDLFVSVDTQTRQRERVNYYLIENTDIIDLFNDSLLGNIEEFILYPGVDMNKFHKRDMISFTPVIGITPKSEIDTDIISRHSVVEFSETNEIFIEYSTPCPPTCPK
ncbi:hypothetical protein D1818_15290 [Aquimarina sp. BL5]|uniref:hypothetical protein n=1 Tax=Aquimarina sp. BL5 TaxID=1714860 RepID=UPI000E51E3A6|nr:hypothetical protein [Aquimarina sp. BL5]AXT52136.1 hypothetical protein D1818_15290 [Aquimarina sp. BL5]RKN10792.1 hypothetical protein D7036_01955 [Aquimarina sp. BL5]